MTVYHVISVAGGWMRDSIANLPLANCMELTSANTGQSNSPPDCLDLDGFESQSLPTKKPHRKVWFFCWQRMRDSNPRKRSQSPVCYRYTNPLFGTVILYPIIRKCQGLFFVFMGCAKNAPHFCYSPSGAASGGASGAGSGTGSGVTSGSGFGAAWVAGGSLGT